MCEQKIRESLRKFMKNEDNIDLFTDQIFSIVQDENSTEYNWQNLVYETMCLKINQHHLITLISTIELTIIHVSKLYICIIIHT